MQYTPPKTIPFASTVHVVQCPTMIRFANTVHAVQCPQLFHSPATSLVQYKSLVATLGPQCSCYLPSITAMWNKRFRNSAVIRASSKWMSTICWYVCPATFERIYRFSRNSVGRSSHWGNTWHPSFHDFYLWESQQGTNALSMCSNTSDKILELLLNLWNRAVTLCTTHLTTVNSAHH
jgi:hypothetical protein